MDWEALLREAAVRAGGSPEDVGRLLAEPELLGQFGRTLATHEQRTEFCGVKVDYRLPLKDMIQACGTAHSQVCRENFPVAYDRQFCAEVTVTALRFTRRVWQGDVFQTLRRYGLKAASLEVTLALVAIHPPVCHAEETNYVALGAVTRDRKVPVANGHGDGYYVELVDQSRCWETCYVFVAVPFGYRG